MSERDLALREMIRGMHPDQIFELVEELPPAVAAALLDEFGALANTAKLPGDPLAQARELLDDFKSRPHLVYLSERIAQAVEDVENGHDRRLIIEMPPRSGKSLLATQVSPAWMLTTHPSWPILVTSYSGQLATSWGRQVRRWIAEKRLGEHVKIRPDAGAASDWELEKGGALRSRSIREGLTGYGAKVLIIDDPHKDFIDAHSEISRDEVWNWWTSVAQTRLQPPSLVVVIMTRWHEDDLVGRLLSKEYDGDPDEWEVIRFPAIAEEHDVLGRREGDPLFSPLIEEDREAALRRWASVKRSVGAYTWSALYQQSPAPAKGAIFDADAWRFWTTDPEISATSPNTVLIDPEKDLAQATWADSWDATFKKTASSDYVVGQRWARLGANRYLIGQHRERMTFTETIAEMLRWEKPESLGGTGRFVHTRLIEDKANGTAILDVLRDKISGLKPVNPTVSKEARARAVTPEIESHNVFLPHPKQPGNEWVADLLTEVRNFPNDKHDDQVDSLSQALLHLREPHRGGIGIPQGRGSSSGLFGSASLDPRRTGAALTDRRRV